MGISGSGFSINSDGSLNIQKYQPAPTQILNRSIKNASVGPAYISVPNGITGVMITMHIYGITGTFTANQGISLQGYVRSSKGGASTMYASTIDSTEVRAHLICFYPGATDTALTPISTARLFKAVGMPVGKCDIGAFLSIKGTFAAGEGIDCEVWADWIM